MRSKILAGLFLLSTLHLVAQSQHHSTYIFGHSLLDHRPPAFPTQPDETTVPHWIHLLAVEAGHTFGATGQYGFLRGHSEVLPPSPNWGYASVPAVWDADTETFAEANLYDVILTAGNFIQATPPADPYDDGINDGLSPVTATITIMDWLATQEDDSLNIFIYENWPEMGGYLANGWPATEAEYDTYNTYLRGAFHTWWLDYYDAVSQARPNANVMMIPVGPIIADLTDGILSDIPVADYYEDADPHGRPTTYFLAGLISYMAIYEEIAPLTFTVPNTVHSEVSDHFTEVVNFIWAELNSFTDDNGNNIAFPGGGGSQSSNNLARVQNAALYIEDDAGIILKGKDDKCYNIFVDELGALVHEEVTCPN